MADTVPSPNMNMPVPVVGTTPGEDWATDVNACLSIIDEHTHTSGQGVPITPDAININANLPLNNNNLITARSVRFSPQTGAINGAADLGCLYEQGIDLYYIDGAGNQVRITQGGSVTGSSGTITGLPSGTASASYAAGTFTFQKATNTPAKMNVGSVVIGQEVASGFGVTVAASGSQVANYNLALPTALPSVNAFMSSDPSGNLSFVANGGNVRASEGGGTITLTNADNRYQTFSLSSDETVKLPTTGVFKGDIWTIINPNPYILTIQSSGANTIIKSWGSKVVLQANVNTPTTAGNWTVLEHTILYGRTWTAFSPVYTGGTTINTGATVVMWRRNGIDTMGIHSDITFSATGTSSAIGLTVPLSLTIPTADYPLGNGSTIGTTCFFHPSSTYWGTAGVLSSTIVMFNSSYAISDSGGTREKPILGNDVISGDVLTGDMNVKIVEWAET
jgi:hypothetical protein